VWSIGCIFAELMTRQTLFKGQHNLKQLEKIVEVLGYPPEEDLEFIDNENTLNYLRRLPRTKRIAWEEKIPGASPLALDLLQRMLRFSPDRRISIREAILHPYFQQSFQDFGEPPRSETTFDWSWDDFELNRELLQKLIYMESLVFHPEEADRLASAETVPNSKDEQLDSKILGKRPKEDAEEAEDANKRVKK